jgi:hypothetical protein
VLVKRGEGGVFDDLAVGLNSGAITRGKAIKLAGAALLSGALGVFAAAPAEAARACRSVEVAAGAFSEVRTKNLQSRPESRIDVETSGATRS